MTLQVVHPVEGRSCADCTKCCEGYLYANINGHPMSIGNPCPLVRLNRGCGDYDNRPYNPCKTFACSWLVNDKIPEEFKPSYANIIMVERESNGFNYIHMTEAGRSIKKKHIEWAKAYAKENNANVVWFSKGETHYAGSVEFGEYMKNNTL